MAFLGMMMVGEITGKSIIFVNNIHTVCLPLLPHTGKRFFYPFEIQSQFLKGKFALPMPLPPSGWDQMDCARSK